MKKHIKHSNARTKGDKRDALKLSKQPLKNLTVKTGVKAGAYCGGGMANCST